jgi:hypothetical protein
MLQANKGNVLTNFHLTSLEIRQYELEYFEMVFEKLSSVATMLGASASAAMMMDVPRRESELLVSIFMLSSVRGMFQEENRNCLSPYSCCHR